MGATYVTAQVRNLNRRGKPFKAEFLVDTGAIDCVAPANALIAAGVKPEGKYVYELADGTPIELQYGFARISFFGSETVVHIAFGPDDREPILGVVAMENTAVAVDPLTKTLHRLHAKPLK